MAQDGSGADGPQLDQPGGRKPVLGQIWKPEPLSWPPRRLHDDSIDDLDAHIAQRIRLNSLVTELCAKHKWAFRPVTFKPGNKDRNEQVAALLSAYGGLPKGTRLNDVPSAVLERAVDQFAAYFGLGGNLEGLGSIPAQLDPQARRAPQQAPW